ncbi:MAG: serine/threonine protein kinase [Elusimicrobia bacterium]|nr:serine/threonine protein kinase [Elusimicrobiota bacterium]
MKGLGDKEGMLASLRMAASLDPAFQEMLDAALADADDSGLFSLSPEDKKRARKAPAGLTKTQRLAVAGGLALAAFIVFVGGVLYVARSRSAAAPIPPAGLSASSAETIPQVARAAPGPEATVVSPRYEVRRKIGQGGMGEVFGGFDRELKRGVAIKRLRPELRENKAELERFLAEARTVAALSCPYIVSIHDIVQREDGVFLVFEYVTGKPLSSILQAAKRLPFAQCRGIFDYVCQAMDFAHRAKVLHLDLKPGNIMVDDNGFVKVMDFGLARHVKDSLSRLTGQAAGGTLAYMAPEQHRGGCCPASDIYAMGVCLYEMATGVLPFRGPDFLAMKESLSYAPPQALAPDIPKGLETVFAEVFTPDPRSRLTDSMEFLQRLKAL